jgi:hypothetical protein
MVKRSTKNQKLKSSFLNPIDLLKTTFSSTDQSLSFSIFLFILIHFVFSVEIVLVAKFFKHVELDPIALFFGFFKRLYKTLSIHTFTAAFISLFFNLDIRTALLIQQLPIVMLPFFILIYYLEILDKKFVIGLYLMFTVEKITSRLQPKDIKKNSLKIFIFKLIISISAIATYFTLKASIFTDI